MNIRFNKQVAAIMKDARQEAKDMGNNYIGSEHLLLSLMKDTTTTFSKVLAAQGVFYFQVKDDLMILFGLKDKEVQEISITQVVDDILERSQLMVQSRKGKSIDADTLTLAMLQTESCVATEILNRYDLQVNMLLREFSCGNMSELDKIEELRNLNALRNNRDIVGRDKEIDLMISVLSRKDKANPMLIGDPGVGKTALVEKLACLIADREVPETLKNAVIYELHLNTLVAGTKYRGDFEEKLQNLIKSLQKYPEVILFIDEIHQMIGAGKSEGSIDVSSVLKPYLARGDIRCIGATTFDEYEKYIAKDRALERRFQIIQVKEPDKRATKDMLLAKMKEYKEYHHVDIRESILDEIVEYCDYFMPNRKFPDKAIDVLDLACVRAKRQKLSEVNELVIRDVIEQLIDIPIASKDRVAYLKASLKERIIGQEEVVNKIMRQVSWIEQGVISNRPLGVWLFLGSSGVGKHTAVEVFNRAYFNQEDLIEIDMAAPEATLNSAITKIHRNPYAVLYVSNLHAAQPKYLQFLKQSITRGYMEQDMQKIDLRHCIVIMSGDFKLESTVSLRFNDRQDLMKQIKKALGEEFMEVFDEVYDFKDLQDEDKYSIMKKMLHVWHKEVDEAAITAVIQTSATLDEAARKLRSHIVHS
ncbi:MAG: ATP-dependent Clp protease ATP-binding subunit [Erysipelotrichaceae bacterium]|nr:ATP-dependent Clp protease ATP-binding subunit [Erysipelotrichaceae bacterium]